MSTAPPISTDPDQSDPYEREAQTFPRLSAEMVERIAPHGREELVPAGTTVFHRGDRSVDFFLVLQGAIDIHDLDAHGAPQPITTLGERQFSGEMDLFNDREVLVSGRTGADSRLIRVQRAEFRHLVAAEPDIGEILMRAFILRRVGFIRHAQGGVVLIGSAHQADTLRLQRFLTRNAYPHRLLDTDTEPDAGGFLKCFAVQRSELPVVVSPDKAVLRNPGTAALAEHLGLTETIDAARVHDVVIVGAGPAGLAAAVYAASEGLSTLVLESTAPGGQAGTSSKIENYLGFPTGISGQALAGRAQAQAQKFGARLAIARSVVSLDCSARPLRLMLDDGEAVQAAAIVIATGARYRQLDVPNHGRYEGQGIHYAATAMEGTLCAGEAVAVVGGGNSAGQAALYLSRHAAHVHMLVRGEGLAATMSDYLVQRITQSAHITLHTHCRITALDGDERLRRVTWTYSGGSGSSGGSGHGDGNASGTGTGTGDNGDAGVANGSGRSETHDIGNIFLMIGAEPNTAWLGGCLRTDERGFLTTGTGPDGEPLSSPYATSLAGVYAVGDVRAGSVKRVASAVGEGSVVVQAVHQYLHAD